MSAILLRTMPDTTTSQAATSVPHPKSRHAAFQAGCSTIASAKADRRPRRFPARRR